MLERIISECLLSLADDTQVVVSSNVELFGGLQEPAVHLLASTVANFDADDEK